MKRLIAVLAVLFLISAPAFALSDEHYLELKKFPGFAAADQKLTQAYNEAEKVMDKSEFEALRESQRDWIAGQRDIRAETFIRDDYSIADAYTRVTLEMAESILTRIRTIQNRVVDDAGIDDIAGEYAYSERDLYMRLSLMIRDESLFEVSFAGRGSRMVMYGYLKPGDKTATFNDDWGDQAVLTFQASDTVSVKVNDTFKDAFDADGTYKRIKGNNN